MYSPVLNFVPSFLHAKAVYSNVFGNRVDHWLFHESEESRLIASGEALLDKNGIISVNTDILAEKETGSVSATLEATVEGPSRRTISGRLRTLVHRGGNTLDGHRLRIF